MPLLFALSFDTADLTRAMQELGEQAPKAMMRALNRTAQGVETTAVKAIAANMGITQAAVRKAMKLVKASQTLLQAEVVGTGKRIPLIEFKARGPEPSKGRGQGVSYRLPGGRGRAERAFIATMKSGHRGVFQRKPAAPRAPIYELKGPSIPKVFADDAIMGAVTVRAEADLEKNLEHEIAYLLQQQ